jgi:hypothetical protein
VRNISFALTTPQVRESYVRVRRGERPLKDVTRRRGLWWSCVLKPGDLLCAVEKSQGIKRGGLVRLRTIRVVSVETERLDIMIGTEYGDAEAIREGFPEMVGAAFVQMFCRHMGGDRTQVVTRIEFEYVDGAA